MLIRRRMLVPSATPEWDYEWYYTDGLPSNDGWTKTGADTPSLQSTGYQMSRSMYSKSVAITNGVIEAKFSIPNYRTGVNSGRAHLRIGDSTNSIYVLFYRYNAPKIVLYDNSNLMSDTATTKIGTFTWDGEYVVRININGSTGSVEINGTTVKDNINSTTMYLPGTLMFGNDAQYGRSIWQYVKYKSYS